MENQDGQSRFPLVITAILIILLLGSIRSVLDLNKGIDRIESAQERLENLKTENLELQEDIEYAQSEEFLEKAAVENLNMTKPGYKVLIIQDPSDTENDPSQPLFVETEKIVIEQEIWQLWIEEFNLANLINVQ